MATTTTFPQQQLNGNSTTNGQKKTAMETTNGLSQKEKLQDDLFFGPSGGETFSNQFQLPRLPIPSLEATLEKFPKVLEALQDTEEEKQETKRVVQEFLKGDGPQLQKLLVEYEQSAIDSGRIGSYVEEFWNDSYLSPDASVVLNLNPFFVLEEGPDPKISKNQTLRAARLIFAALKFASQLKNESLPPDVIKKVPLCMDQFHVLFGAARVPEKDNNDAVHVYPDSTHVAVMIRNQLYYFRALWPEDFALAVDERDIIDILEAIQKHAEQADNNAQEDLAALGVLTSLPRSQWASVRQEMIDANPLNKGALHVVDSALFVLVLDDFIPSTVHEAAANILHGTNQLQVFDETNNNKNDNDSNNSSNSYNNNDNCHRSYEVQLGTCCNRWYDKLQIIVCSNGLAGINFEHSSVDGHTALRFVSDIYAETVVQFAQSITKLIHGNEKIPDVVHAPLRRAALSIDSATGKPTLDVFPKKLMFQVSPSIMDRIFYSETALCDQIIASDTVVLEFHNYGKQLIVANKLSPDSFVQMIILLAYYRLYGKVVCMYEPVLTKRFYHGRTEAMRTVTPQAKEFCEIFVNGKSTKEDKLQALRKATQEHSRLVKESASGYGVDRHLFALKCIAAKNNVKTPEFFKSEPWKLLNHTILSTSNCGNPSLRLFGFGPVVQDGFGVGYIIKDHGLHFSVSSKHRQTKRYVNTLKNTLLDFMDLLKSTSLFEVNHEEHVSLKTIESKNNTSRPSTPEVATYDDFYGESALPKFDKPGANKNLKKPPARRQSSGSFFENVLEKGQSQLLLDLSAIQTNVALSTAGSFDAGDNKSYADEDNASEADGFWYSGITRRVSFKARTSGAS